MLSVVNYKTFEKTALFVTSDFYNSNATMSLPCCYILSCLCKKQHVLIVHVFYCVHSYTIAQLEKGTQKSVRKN